MPRCPDPACARPLISLGGKPVCTRCRNRQVQAAAAKKADLDRRLRLAREAAEKAAAPAKTPRVPPAPKKAAPAKKTRPPLTLQAVILAADAAEYGGTQPSGWTAADRDQVRQLLALVEPGAEEFPSGDRIREWTRALALRTGLYSAELAEKPVGQILQLARRK